VLEQFDSPANILAAPANDFVSDFVGADRGLKRLNLVRTGEAMRSDIELVRDDELGDEVASRMRQRSFESLLVVDDAQMLVGSLSLDVAQANPGRRAGEIASPVIATTEQEATMKDAFSEMLSTGVGYMPVLGDEDKVVGIVTAGDAQRLIEEAGQGQVAR
jgi:osmoprotectant transport system ATP-binding protein